MNKFSLSILKCKIEGYLEIYNLGIKEYDKIIINEFSKLTYKEAKSILNLVWQIDKKRKFGKVDLSITTPHDFSI